MPGKDRGAERPDAAANVPTRWALEDPAREEAGAAWAGRERAGRGRREALPPGSGGDWLGGGRGTLCPTPSQCSVV